MYLSVLSAVAAIVFLPLLVSASPVSRPEGISIPITSHISEFGRVADIDALRAQLAHLQGLAPSYLFLVSTTETTIWHPPCGAGNTPTRWRTLRKTPELIIPWPWDLMVLRV
jgi:hypothetical protein